MKHMKKIVIGLIVMLMALSTVLTLVSCSSDIYGGNFKEVTDETKIEQIMKDVGNAMSGIEDWSGLNVNLDFKVTGKGSVVGQSVDENIALNCNAYLIYDEDDIQLSLEFNMKNGAETNEMKLYIKDNTLYKNTNIDGKTEKTKLNLDDLDDPSALLDIIDDLTVGMGSAFNLGEINLDDFDIGSILSDDSLRIYTTGESGARNIKFTIEDLDVLFFNGLDITLTVALDANNNLKGIKAELGLAMESVGVTTTISGTVTAEVYTGEIKFPGDLDSYVAG